MNVLTLNYEFPPMGGGAGNATANISRELVRLGHRVSVVTSRLKGEPARETLDGVQVHRVFSWRKGIHDCGFRGAYSYLIAAAPVVWRLIRQQRFDVAHVFFSLPTGVLTFLPGQGRIPYVVSLRGSDVPYYDTHNTWVHRMNLLLRPVNRSIWRRAARVVALSDGLRRTARRTDAEVRIDVIPNGVETELFTPREASGVRSGPVRLICVSRLIQRKGIDHLLQALSKIGDDESWTLSIVGTGSHERSLRALASELGLDGNVEFVGFRPRTELPELYREADAFVLPSLAESFGMVFAEAMASGLAIVGGRTGGVPDLVREENGILVEPGNVVELEAGLRRILGDASLRERMGEANRRRVVESYSWGAIAKQYERAYSDEISAGAGGLEAP